MTDSEKGSMLDRLRTAREARDALRREGEEVFTETVREAMRNRDGLMVREIAEAAGLSRERVYQIAGGRR